MEKYKIVSITHSDGAPRNDGRYPQRIGRICGKPIAFIGQPLFIEYIYKADGSDYRGYTLRTSLVERVSETGSRITVETMNSIYEFEKVED
ncbi:MAG: hypothetical protein E6600_04645 [Anaerocolumna aminovalerica]|uniref:hypothetical protein n=1 Tax=Anaerocolumna aminovalerica TaxID=1527 RepID=UPI0029077385|nr:hypothetical protein [Anaerocolumna aminovalerica]MDU6263771.1 hypothetical protein [Anaerocolumna aminovalerica]